MSVQLGFHVDMRKCTGCRTCVVACKDLHDLAPGQLFRRVVEVEGGGYGEVGAGAVVPHVFAYYISMACNHCDDPRCVRNCPTGALVKNPVDGVVSIDPGVCIGCRYCTWSCPYGAPQYNPAAGRTQKCDLCAGLRAAGEEPACAAACPMRAIAWGPITDLLERHGGTTALAALPDSRITRPNAIYTPHRDAGRRLRP
ncbi:MAG TPA: DMSO/selenate family reductase complex B subunit [Symbiobacteriaceae bacterium]|nr:DMSO/selenate family reductase complex B subunit [Symbiobacteriaceae bacterium]